MVGVDAPARVADLQLAGKVAVLQGESHGEQMPRTGQVVQAVALEGF